MTSVPKAPLVGRQSDEPCRPLRRRSLRLSEQGGEFVLDANLGQLGEQAGLSVLGDGNLVRLELKGGDVPGDLAAAVEDQAGLVADDRDDGGLAATPCLPCGLVGLGQGCTSAHSRIQPLPPCPGHLKKNKCQGKYLPVRTTLM